MKHAKFSLVFSLFILTMGWVNAFAAKVYTPSSVRSMSSAKTYCAGVTASRISFGYNTCNVGSGSSTGTVTTVKWYQNTVNSTTGGTLVNTSSRSCRTSSNGSMSYRPSTTVAGIYYYYCVITWTGAGTCNTGGSLTSATTAITVSSAPSAIAGASTVCIGSPTTLTNTASGGTWSTSSATVATVGSLTGIVNGVSAGTAYISYRVACGTTVTKLVTVTSTPTVASIGGGASKICSGTTTTLTNTTSGGAWSTAASSIATVGATGIVTGVASGITNISYAVTNTCGTTYAAKEVTVTATPAAISGVTNLCAGYTTTYTNTVPYGSWTSSSTAKATINAATGLITGVAAGTTLISYSTGCGAMATKTLTVNTSIGANTGTASVCEGATTTLANAATGGTWSSGNTSIATVGAASGVVSGVAAGTVAISYTTGGSCGAVTIVTVRATPASISGAANVCTGNNITFSNATSFGTWSSSNVAVGSIVSTTGIASGRVQGTTTISYATGCGTPATKALTVYTTPAAIGGTAVVCEGATTTLTNSVTGGTWTSSDATLATVAESTGVVTGVAAGLVNITYTNGTCYAVKAVTVNPLPIAGTLSGDLSLCDGDETSLIADGEEGGTWSATNAAIATVDADGLVTAQSAGTAVISYSVTNGCGTAAAAGVVTVNVTPDAGVISGTLTVCASATTTLAAASDGVWSAANAATATVGTDGIVSGITAGTTEISYSISNICGVDVASSIVTVNPLPSAGTITGTAVVCESATTTLTNAIAGGVWTTSDASVATVGTTGIVSGIVSGNATISYAVTNDCGIAYATKIITVNPLPNAGAISGAATVCVASSEMLTNVVSGGVWSSANSSVATVGTTGSVTGVTAAGTTISYTFTNSCGSAYATHTLTIAPLPTVASITGAATVCADATTTFANTTAGGVWSSSNASVATVGTDGVVSGITAGDAAISYTVSDMCGSVVAVKTITVNPSSAAITGATSVCQGGTTTFSIVDPAGTWVSGAPSVATINAATGVITSVGLGVSTITYSAVTGCFQSVKDIVVNNTVGDITGMPRSCEGQSSALACATAGGSWSSSNTAVAAVDAATGDVTGVTAGSATITYTAASGCYTTVTYIVYAMPAPVTGANTICTGSYTVLYSTIGGSGTWSSSDTTVATANLTSGMITSASVGTATITYKIPASGCFVTKSVTVNATPAAITGATAICAGNTQAFTSATTDGAWSSSQPSVASIDAATGVATAVTAGNTTISYVMPTGCYKTYATSVNPLPASITYSADNICLGKTANFASATTGGTWSSSNTAVGTINTASGVASSINLGTTTITYRAATGCVRTKSLSVYNAIATISGADMVCKGQSTLYTIATTSGSWLSGSTSIASINSVTGMVTGMSAGSAKISYRLTGGCLTFKNVTVAAITGTSSVCVGLSTTLNHLIAAGTWSSSNAAVATINAATGVLTGVAPGTSTITYNVGGGAYNTVTAVVNALPAAITGSATVCSEASALYAGTVGGSATWSSSNVSVATINTTSGMATGVSAGTTTLTYKIAASGCFTTRQITVNPAPAAITGPSTACVGTTVTLASATTDGTWASNPTTVATVGSTSGVVAATSAGGVTVSYTLANGCRKTKVITVKAAPAVISGPAVLSPGSSSAFSCASAGGTWSVSDAAIAAITSAAASSASVSAVSAGLASILYTLSNGCSKSKNVNVVGTGARSAETVTDAVVDFKMYPNPTNGTFTVESSVNGSFSVYTFDGKLVNEYLLNGTTTVSLPSDLVTGVYICQFRFEDGTTKTSKLYFQN